MTVATSLKKYLADQGIEYEVVTHPTAPSASRTAQASHVSGERIAKAVVLKGEEGYALAVLPATHRIRLDELRDRLNRRVDLAKEEETAGLFADCELGAIPPVGAAYGLDVIVDDSLPEQGDIYFEGGDHASLVRVAAEQFSKLMEKAKRGKFSYHD